MPQSHGTIGHRRVIKNKNNFTDEIISKPNPGTDPQNCIISPTLVTTIE